MWSTRGQQLEWRKALHLNLKQVFVPAAGRQDRLAAVAGAGLAARVLMLYWYTSLFYNTVLRLATKVGLEASLRRIQPQAEQALGTVTGKG